MIVQHQSEARKRPSITALTTMWADQNISRMLVSGVAAAAATSAGFIGVGDLLLAGGTARATAAREPNRPGSAPEIGRNLGFCRMPEKPEFLAAI
jgi:hypothetical protein